MGIQTAKALDEGEKVAGTCFLLPMNLATNDTDVGLCILENVGEAVVYGEVLYLKPESEYTEDRKSTRLNSSHIPLSRMPSSA